MEDNELKQCPYCAEMIKKAAIKCRYCGSRVDKPARQGGLFSEPGYWHRVNEGKKVAGVCSGIAKQLESPVILLPLRVFFILTTLFYGFGVMIYIILWIIMPPPADTPFAVGGSGGKTAGTTPKTPTTPSQPKPSTPPVPPAEPVKEPDVSVTEEASEKDESDGDDDNSRFAPPDSGWATLEGTSGEVSEENGDIPVADAEPAKEKENTPIGDEAGETTDEDTPRQSNMLDHRKGIIALGICFIPVVLGHSIVLKTLFNITPSFMYSMLFLACIAIPVTGAFIISRTKSLTVQKDHRKGIIALGMCFVLMVLGHSIVLKTLLNITPSFLYSMLFLACVAMPVTGALIISRTKTLTAQKAAML